MLSALTLTDVVIGGLWILIIALFIGCLLAITGIWPWEGATRIITLPESSEVQLDTPSVFAVQQSINADIVIEAENQEVTDPYIIFKDVGCRDVEVELTQAEDSSEWRGNCTLKYTTPGEPKIDYQFGSHSHHATVGEIAPLTEHYRHLTNRILLVFSALTGILAAASLIVSLNM